MESNNNDYGKIIRNVGLFLGIPLVICLLMWLLFDNRTSAGDVKYSDFVGYFERGEVEHFELDLGSRGADGAPAAGIPQGGHQPR